MSRRQIHIGSDAAASIHAAASWWEAVSGAAIGERGVCHVALAGGSTPRALYELLASPLWRERIDWTRMHFWFGDERCVPPEHAGSNYRMARETLLSRVPVDAERIHRIRGEIDPTLAAQEYEDALLRTVPPADRGSLPALDLVLLGIGTDGHIASLFPDTDILNRGNELVAAVWVAKLASWRISITLPLINAARRVAVLAIGPGKADIIASVLGDVSGAYPAQMVQPAAGLDWFIDRSAAAGIEGRSPT